MTRRKSEGPAALPCGCSAARGPLRLCDLHARAPELAGLLDTIRGHYLNLPGGPWPFVEAIDRLVPRRAGHGGREADGAR